MLPKAIVLDKDGTLIDSESMERRVTITALNGLGYEFDAKLGARLLGHSVANSLPILREVYGSSFPTGSYVALREKTRNLVKMRPSDLFPSAIELLELLKASNVPMAVATSATRNIALRDLSECGILDYFKAVVTIDDVLNGKPHPQTYLRAAEYLGVQPSDSVAIEDSAVGAQSALSAGFFVFCLSSPSDQHVYSALEPSSSLSLACPDLGSVLACLTTSYGWL